MLSAGSREDSCWGACGASGGAVAELRDGVLPFVEPLPHPTPKHAATHNPTNDRAIIIGDSLASSAFLGNGPEASGTVGSGLG